MKLTAKLLIPLVVLAGLLLATGGVAFAHEIGLGAMIGSGAKVEFLGAVDSIASDTWVVAGRTVQVGPRTEIKGTINAGDTVKVHALVGADGVLIARELALSSAVSDDSSDDEMEITGTVEAISTTSWTVSGQTFAVTPETEIKGTIIVGDVVKVHLFTDAGGVLTAREIELFTADDDGDDDGETQEFTGTVEALSAESITVSGQVLAITPDSEFEDTIVVGDLVKVHATLNPNGSMTLREIELLSGDDSGGDDDSDGEDRSGGDHSGSDDDSSQSGEHESGDDDSGEHSGGDDGGSHDSGDDDGGSGGDD